MSYRRNYTRTNSNRGGSGWRGPPALEILYDSITLSAANTFTEIEVSLLEEVGKLRFGRVKAMMVAGIELDFTAFDDAVADKDAIMLQAASSEEGAEITLNNKDLVFKVEPTVRLLTSGATIIDASWCKWFPHGGIPYFKKRIWFGATSIGHTAALTVNFRIYYYFKYLNKKQQTRIISQLQ